MYKPTEMEITIYAMSAEMSDNYNQPIQGQSENPVVFLLPFPILRAQFG